MCILTVRMLGIISVNTKRKVFGVSDMNLHTVDPLMLL